MNEDSKFDLKAGVAAALFFLLLFGVVTLDLAQGPGVRVWKTWDAQAQHAEDPEGIALFMFGQYAMPLQILSAALLVALVGALVLAKPEPEHAEEDAP